MDRRRRLVAVGSTTALVLTVVGSAAADGDRSDRHRVLQLTATTEERTDVDVAPTGNSMGDYFVLRNSLHDRKGRDVGMSAGVFVTIDAADPSTGADDVRLATVGLELAGGTVTLQGFVYPGQDNTLAVTGGTGRYSAARGEMRFTPKVGPDNTYYLRLQLRP